MPKPWQFRDAHYRPEGGACSHAASRRHLLARVRCPGDRPLDIGFAEPYGECITHAAGRYERWQEWQALSGASRAAAGYPDRIGSTEYDQWPRGWIVYETPSRWFVVYADRRLQQPAVIEALKTAFGLNGAEVIVRSDSHYR
jgi:hypothetical protein